MIVLWIVSILLVTVSCGPHSARERRRIAKICGRFPETPQEIKSIGGRPAKPEEAPWAVALRINGEAWCSGSLISDRFVITAAHCYFDYSLSELQAIQNHTKYKLSVADVAVNALYANETGPLAQIRNISRIYSQVHYSVDRNEHHEESDVVLLELDSPVKLSEHTGPVCLPNRETPLGVPLEFFGYGGNPEKNSRLYKYETKSAECLDEGSGYYNRIDVSCASYPSRLACGGDSGGGYIETLNNRKYIISTLSGGVACWAISASDNRSYSDYNTNLFPHLPWICRYSGLCDENRYIKRKEKAFQGDTIIFERSAQPVQDI